MYTLGYSFRPWTEAKAIADGPSILELRPRDRARVRRRRQDPLRPPRRARRVVDARRRAGRSRRSAPTPARPSASPAASCSCAAATTATTRATRPDFPGTERFPGQIVHPQNWTDDVDYAGKRVVVIGSGATAVTLVPAMAETRGARDDAPALAQLRRLAARRRTRSPTSLRRVLPAKLAYSIVRWKNVLLTMLVFQLSRRRPRCDEGADPQGRSRAGCRRATTSTPTSSPATTRGTSACAWCRTATSSRRSRDGRASVVTDQIETFTETGPQARVRRRSSRPTSSSPPPASTCCRSAACSSRSTAATSSSPRRSATRG